MRAAGMKLRYRFIVLILALAMLVTGSGIISFAETMGEESSNFGVSAESSSKDIQVEDDAEKAAIETAEDPKKAPEEPEGEKLENAAEEQGASEEPSGEASDAASEKDDAADVTSDKAADGPDTGADIETAAGWEKTIPSDLSSDIRKAMVQVAKSQLKYKESSGNYKEDKNGRHAYTRYGEFAGEPYADEWDAAFVLFVLNYSGVADTAGAIKENKDIVDQDGEVKVPVETDTKAWVKALRSSGMYIDAKDSGDDIDTVYAPEEGDLVFFDYTKTDSEHSKGLNAGIITGASDSRIEVVMASTGTERNVVIQISCGLEDVAGYVSLKSIAPKAFMDETGDDEASDTVSDEQVDDPEASDVADNTDAESVENSGSGILVSKSITADITGHERKGLRKLFKSGSSGSGDAVITISGELPENAYAAATPVDVEIEGQEVLTAFDITIYTNDADGKPVEWQPLSPVSVSIHDSRISSEKAPAGLEVYHMEDAEAEPQLVAETAVKDNEVVFEAESFSIYAISAPTYYITYELYLDKEFTEPYIFDLDGEPSTKDLESNRIIVKNGDTLVFPAEPTSIENFRGWFTANNEEVRPGPVSGITMTQTIPLYARNGDTAFVVFHERQITETSGGTTNTYFPVTSTEKVLLTNGSGSIDISEIRPQIAYDDLEFVGWSTSNSTTDGDRTVIDAQQVAGNTNITDYQDGLLTVTGTVNLYPVYKSVRYVRFYTGAVGSGASYISTSSVGTGDPLSDARPVDGSDNTITPTWTGYEFLGWTRESNITEGGEINYNKLVIWDDEVAGGADQLESGDYFTNAQWDSQTEAVNSDITLYAVWKPVDSAQYNIAVWYQSINDTVGMAPEEKSYVLHHTVNGSGTPGTLLDYTSEAQASGATGDNDETIATPTGFEFSRGESATIEPDGSTTINVYYDRQVYTVIVKPGDEYHGTVHGTGTDAVYAETSDTSGRLYGSTSGKTADQLTSDDVFEIEYRFKGWRTGNTYHTGTVYNAWLVIFSRAYGNPPGVPAGTRGYINPTRLGINTGTATAEYAWFKAGTNEEYTGTRYKEMEPYVAYYTGLYEQPIGFDYSMKYYYQPSPAKHIRLSDTINNNQYYLIRGTSDAGNTYASSHSDNDTLYISKNQNNANQSIVTTLGRSQTNIPLTAEYSALLKNSSVEDGPANIQGDYFFAFRTGSSNIIDTPALYPVELAAFNYEGIDSNNARYRLLQLSDTPEQSVTLYKANATGVWYIVGTYWTWSTQERDVSLYKVNSIGAETPNLNGNTLTVFANSETDTYAATTSYYKVDAPDASAAGFTPYANYNAFLNEYKNKVANEQVSKFGGSAQTTGTNIDVSGIAGALDGYTYKWYYNNSWKAAANNVSTAGSSTDIKLLFEPDDVTVRFVYDRNENGTIDSGEEAGTITLPRGFSFSCFTETGVNPNATYVESYRDGAGITPPSGKVFDSWCYDIAGSQTFDPSNPVTSDITLYAKFDYAWYTANIDPRGGVINGGTDGSTWFWRQTGSYINKYENIMRTYIESDEGTYYYYYNDQDAYNTYEDPATPETEVNRTSGYVLVSDVNNWTQIDSTTYQDGDGLIYANIDTSVTYAGDYTQWKLVDWYDESTGAPYDFSSPVTKDTYIYAVWKNLETYMLRFDAGNGFHIGSNSIDVLPSTADDTHTRTLNEHFIDGSEVLVQYYAEPDDPQDNIHQFRGWRMKNDSGHDDNVYQLGELLNIDYHYADENGIITLEAVYDKLGTTDITYDANGGSGTLTDLDDSGIRSIGTNRLYNIEINDKFNLSGGDGFTRTGYMQIGWSTVSGRKATEFDPETNRSTDFDLEEEVLVDDISSNTLYAVWQCPEIEVYTYKNGDWQNGTMIAEGEYAPSSMASKTPHEMQEAAKSGLDPNDYDLSEYTFGYAKIRIDNADVDVTNVRFSSGKWEISTDNGTNWQLLPPKPLRVYYFKTEIVTPVDYIKVENDGSYSDLQKGTASGLVKNDSTEEETVTESAARSVKDDLVGAADGLVVDYASNYSGYAYAIGSSDKADGLYGISQNLKLRNDKDGFRYSTDGVNWTLWDIDVDPHIYVVYYPKGFVYVTVQALMTGDLIDTTKDIPYTYEISTTTWSRTVTRSGSTRPTWNEGTMTSSAAVTESDSFTLRSGQSRVFVLNNIAGPAQTSNSNDAVTVTATTQSITVSQDWLDYYTLEITDVKDADGSPGEGVKNDSADPGTYTISSIRDNTAPELSYNQSGNSRSYYFTFPDSGVGNIIQDDTTATFNNIRKVVNVDIEKTLDDVMATQDKTFIFSATASEIASDGTTISCTLDPVQISLHDTETKTGRLLKAPVGSRLLITESAAAAYASVYEVKPAPTAVKTADAASDLTELLIGSNSVRFRVPASTDDTQKVIATVHFTNKRRTVNVKILKVDEFGAELEGAKFELGQDSSPLPVGSALATNGSSTVLDGEMYYEGEYPLNETVTPEQYKDVSGTITVSVSRTGVVTAASVKLGELEVTGSTENGYIVKVKNEPKPLPAPTAVDQKYLPYILMLIAGCALVALVTRSRRRDEEDETAIE